MAGEALADRVHPRRLDSGTHNPGTGGLEYGVKGAGEVRSAVTNQEVDVCEPLVEAEGQVAGLLHGPLAGGVRGDAAEVHPAGAVLDEHQDIPSLAQHGVRVQEVDREDPGGLGVQELPPGRARAARRWIDARSMQDLPDSGRGDRHAELGQFAVDAAVSPQWILFARRTTRRVMPGPVGGRPGVRRLLVSYLPATSLRCQASSVAGVTGKMAAQRLPNRSAWNCGDSRVVVS